MTGHQAAGDRDRDRDGARYKEIGRLHGECKALLAEIRQSIEWREIRLRLTHEHGERRR